MESSMDLFFEFYVEGFYNTRAFYAYVKKKVVGKKKVKKGGCG